MADAPAAAAPGPASELRSAQSQVTETSLQSAQAVVKPASTGAPRVFYVDSSNGNDKSDGRTPTAAAGTSGPWKTLAKLTTAALQPGDTVALACGSTWGETLKLGASGTAANPISVTAYPSGCATPPVIDGGTAIPATAWTKHSGNIYKASIASAPQRLYTTAGIMSLAHHPNRGFDSSQPDSLYAKVAANANQTVVGGRTVSTNLTIGSDLVLPAGATLTAGTKVRIRTNSWTLDESTVSSMSGKTLTLSTPTTYPLYAGWGYFLLGQLWMLDSAGEWHYDNATQTLYVWMPDSAAPGARVVASTMPTGIDLQSAQYVTVDGVHVRYSGVGVDAKRSVGVAVRNSRIEDSAGMGIDVAASVGITISGNALLRTGGDAINGVDNAATAAASMTVVNNSIADSGVTLNGDSPSSLPIRSGAAIRAGTAAVITGNTITNAGYTGIWPQAGSKVDGNLVNGACSVLDDCAAIYVGGKNVGATISNNLITHSRGALAGKGPSINFTQAQGIYLDESASGTTVSGNTVTDCDYGIHLHVAANNLILQNKLYGNRVGQLWMQETRKTDSPTGDVFGNTIKGNQLVPIDPTARSVLLDTQFTDTAHFGTFDGNRYYDRLIGTVANERTISGSAAYTMSQWKAAITAAGASRGNDVNGWAASQTLYAPTIVNGNNVVPNGAMLGSTAGWTVWNQTAPYGKLVRESCAAGWCARYVTGASVGLVSSPNFSVVSGTWYRLTLDILAGVDGQSIDILVRRGGGGANGYESLSDRSLKTQAGTKWNRYSVIFKATKTVKANDPQTGDLGARIDVQNILPGQSVSLANVEVVPVLPADGLNRSDLLLNSQANPMQAACPLAASQPALCSSYLRLSDGQAVSWPMLLPARSGEIVFMRDSRLVDSDGDGIADSQDVCPNSPAGRGVDSRGCAMGQ